MTPLHWVTWAAFCPSVPCCLRHAVVIWDEIPLKYSRLIFLKYLRTLVFICDSNLSIITVYHRSTCYCLVKYEAPKYAILVLVEKQRYYVCLHLLLLK